MAAMLPETTTHTPVCFAYSRVSTDGQAKHGLSLPDQKERLEGYYQHALKPLGVIWGDLYVDAGVSAAKFAFCDRPAGRQIVERARAGDHIVMTSLDRGFRRLRDACATIEEWTTKKINVHFLNLGLATSTPTGRLVLHILGAIAEFQRDLISESTRNGLARRKELCGTATGKAKAGDKVVGTGKAQRLAPDPVARSIGKLLVQLYIDGKVTSCVQAYWEFRSRGLRDRKGREWSPDTLSKLRKRCLLENWQDQAAVLPPVLPPNRANGPHSAPRVNRLTVRSSSNQPADFYSETPATDAITSSSVTPS